VRSNAPFLPRTHDLYTSLSLSRARAMRLPPDIPLLLELPQLPHAEETSGRPGRLDPSKLSAIATVLPAGLDSSTGSGASVRLPPPPISVPPPRFLGFGSDAYGDADAAGAAAELLKNSVLLTISVPSLSTSVKLRFRATSSVDAAKQVSLATGRVTDVAARAHAPCALQVLHRKLLKDELLVMSFWNPATGIPLRPDRSLQDYLLKNEVRCR
jgi:hypothetical protein